VAFGVLGLDAETLCAVWNKGESNIGISEIEIPPSIARIRLSSCHNRNSSMKKGGI